MSEEKLKRIGKPWSQEEEKQLLSLLQEKTIMEISKIHQRTTGGIKSRIKKIAICMVNSNYEVSDILHQTRLSQEEFDDILIQNKIVKSSSFPLKKTNRNEIIDELKILNTNMQKIIELLSNNVGK